jgi:hypothetical protein
MTPEPFRRSCFVPIYVSVSGLIYIVPAPCGTAALAKVGQWGPLPTATRANLRATGAGHSIRFGPRECLRSGG